MVMGIAEKDCIELRRVVAWLLPLCLVYGFIVLFASTNIFQHDEARYVRLANNLSHGYYADRAKVDLSNGPGYPIVLLPFVLLKLPLLCAKLLNAVFLFGAVLYFYYTLCLYIERGGLCLSFLFGLYPPFLRYLSVLMTETFVYFLVCGFVFHFCKLYQNGRNSWIQLGAASFYLGYLALTKVIFGYVVGFCLVLSICLFLWKRKDTTKRTLLVYSFALAVCVPYLIYTYSLTGKVFYWGSSGGESLYWMSSPYPNELGDWHSRKEVRDHPQLRRNHQEFFDQLSKLDEVQRDVEYKRRAIQNIAHNPVKYLRNWIANIGRLLFSYPYSYLPQTLLTFFRLIPNLFLIVLFLLSLYPSYVGRKVIPYEIYSLALFGGFYFGGSSLLSAYNRFFCPLVPILSLWIIFTGFRILRIEIRK